ncbi:MAG: PEP-CTERM sorting domain-containing protein [Cyanobacteria bacterium J06632_3]
MNRISLVRAAMLAPLAVLASPSFSRAAKITFDDQGFSGPSLFDQAGDAVTLNIQTDNGNVRFEGGVLLTNATNSPANQTTTYGTANGLSGGLFPIQENPTRKNPITITFENPVQNFFLDVFNGLSVSGLQYTVADDIGNSSTFSLDANNQGGFQKIGFQATGTTVTVTADTTADAVSPFPAGAYDFFIDNVTFNAPLPNDLLDPFDEVVVPMPEPAPIPDPAPIPNPNPVEPSPSSSPVSVPEPVSVLSMLTIGVFSLVRRSQR